MRLALTTSFLLLLGACGAKAADKLAGTYEIDAKATTAIILEELKKQPGYDAAAAPTVAEAMSNATKGMSMELKADGTLLLKGTGKDEAGTWKLDGSKITITAKVDGKDDVQHGTVEGDTIKVTRDAMGKPLTVVLAKKK